MLTSIGSSMEMRIGNGPYTPVTATSFSLSDQVDGISSGTTLTVGIRIKATATAPARAEKVFTLYPRGAKPTTVVFDIASTSLKGYTTAMEYKLGSDTSWRALSGTVLSLITSAKADQDVKVYVRMKATNSASASLPVEFTIPQLTEGPSGTIDYANETITGLANGSYQYGINGASWTALTVTDGKWDISSLVGTSAKTLYLRRAATATTPITAYTTFAIAARPAAPTSPVFVYDDFDYPDKVVLERF